MSNTAIRPYEISVWTLQDSFITVLKPYEIELKGQLITPLISLKDSEITLNFSIPMYCRNASGELLLNPLWSHVEDGVFVKNLRKLKVILNKGEEGEGIFEFLIHDITESHKSGILTCEISANGLPFEELGKIGYKLSLNYDEYILDLDNLKEKEDFLPTLNYWASKVFKNTNWNYSIQMDWSSYDGVIDTLDGKIIDYKKLSNEEKDRVNSAREEKGLRRRDRIYEDDYVSSWSLDELTDKLIPSEVIKYQEKSRVPEIEKSNIYNISQELAELFGVFVRYEYRYDENYHIIGRECIFHNTYLDEKEGKFDITYPYQASEIIRKIESSDVITKMYVPTSEDNSIIEVAANKSKEDYILNFDYLYSVGTITQEQYNEIAPYERKMYRLNTDYQQVADKFAKLQTELVELRAEETTLNNSISYALEQIRQADDLLIAITDGEGILYKTNTNPEMLMILKDGDNYKANISLEGIYGETVKLFRKMENSIIVQESEIQGFSFVYDDTTHLNIIGLTNINTEDSGRAYITCAYQPRLKYERVKAEFENKYQKDSLRLEEVRARLIEIEDRYDEEGNLISTGEYTILTEKLIVLLEEQEQTRASFERMMGPALREGSWEAEDNYLDYGDHYFVEKAFFPNNGSLIYSADKTVSMIWDTELFEEEENIYLEVGVDMEKQFRTIFPLSLEMYSRLKEEDLFEDIVIKYEIPVADGIAPPEIEYLGANSSFVYSFITDNSNKIIPVMMLLDFPKIGAQNFQLGLVDYNSPELDFNVLFDLSSIQDLEKHKIVYPRIEFKDRTLKNNDDELIIYQNNIKLTRYEDYSILRRDEFYYLTIKSLSFLNGNLINHENIFDVSANDYDIEYVLSNANLHLYLDALEVSKTNAFPQVSYEVSLASLNKNFLKYSYLKLNKIANINDSDLQLENILGYISEIELVLDKPWEDTFTIKNYKTKFEDLFSKIVASTETMRQNQVSYDKAGAAFTSGNSLAPEILQNTLNTADLQYSFNNGNLLIDELNGIWAMSDSGVIAMRGGGIFCATEKDAYGNWIWNTGILPTGINASLLNAGAINTNLIRIYSEGNMRFQMNGEGLFSYAQNPDGTANLDTYVVHKDEGLFLTKKTLLSNGEEAPVDLVEVSWDGFILRNNNNEKVFSADNVGNLTITGTLTAQSIVEVGNLKLNLSDTIRNIRIDSAGGGHTFKYTNLNYDGEIKEDPKYLYFRVIHNFCENTYNKIKFYISTDYNSWNELYPSDALGVDTLLTWTDKNLLTFVVTNNLLPANSENNEIFIKVVSELEDGAQFDSIITINKEAQDVNKYISKITPNTYTFKEIENKDFYVSLENVPAETGAWYLNDILIEDSEGLVSVTLSSEVVKDSSKILTYKNEGISREASLIYFESTEITKIETYYCYSNDGDTAPEVDTGDDGQVWYDNIGKIPQEESSLNFLWTKTVYYYSDGTQQESFIVTKNSKEIAKIAELYALGGYGVKTGFFVESIIRDTDGMAQAVILEGDSTIYPIFTNGELNLNEDGVYYIKDGEEKILFYFTAPEVTVYSSEVIKVLEKVTYAKLYSPNEVNWLSSIPIVSGEKTTGQIESEDFIEAPVEEKDNLIFISVSEENASDSTSLWIKYKFTYTDGVLGSSEPVPLEEINNLRLSAAEAKTVYDNDSIISIVSTQEWENADGLKFTNLATYIEQLPTEIKMRVESELFNKYFLLNSEGVRIGEENSAFSTLTDNIGFRVQHQTEGVEDRKTIGTFDAYGLNVPEITMRNESYDRADRSLLIVLKGTSSGGWIWTKGTKRKMS